MIFKIQEASVNHRPWGEFMKLILIFILGLSSSHFVLAEETVSESIEVKTNNVKRSIKRGINKIKEENCRKGKVKCLTIKSGHKIEEATESASDKTKEVINKID